MVFGLFSFQNNEHLQSSDDGNVSISILSFTPARDDNGKILICRAINEVMKHSIRETSLKLNIYCEYLILFVYWKRECR